MSKLVELENGWLTIHNINDYFFIEISEIKYLDLSEARLVIYLRDGNIRSFNNLLVKEKKNNLLIFRELSELLISRVERVEVI